MSKCSTLHDRKLKTHAARGLLAALLALFAACARTTPTGEEGAATNSTPVQTNTTGTQTQTTPAPADSDSAPAVATRAATLEEVRVVVAHIYRDAVTVEGSRGTPFVVGDFNGDGSEDLAVVVRPGAGKLTAVNDEYANWIVEDPLKVATPEVHGDTEMLPKKSGPVIVRQGDSLLAVIHGYRQMGWRDPLASQTYLLKGGVGGEMKVQPASEALGELPNKARLSQPLGDVIRETLAGTDGFIYWTGTKYAWYAPTVESR